MSRTALVAGLMLAISTTAVAQKPQPIELGMDASLAFWLNKPRITTLTVPLSQVRVGFPIAPQWSLEPMLGLTYIGGSGGNVTNLTLGVGALYHFAARPSGSQVYIRPFLQTTQVSGGGFSSGTTAFGGGLGIKVPVLDRLKSRFEAAYSTSNNTKQLMFLAGLSFFTH